MVELGAALVLPGHEDVIDDPARRAREIGEHHEARLSSVAAAVGDRPLNAYAASLSVFPAAREPISRLFAFFETLSHLEYLAIRDRLERIEAGDGTVAYS